VGIGALLLRLLPETKTNRTTQADVLLAYRTAGGLCPGMWFHRVRRNTPDWYIDTDSPMFVHANGTAWTSQYFRSTFLYPSLYRQQATDPMLAQMDGSEGNSIEERFWSLHSYKRGARSHVTRGGTPGMRKATNDEIYEHARWARKQSKSEAIDVIYREWNPIERIRLTLLCM
jgi:hypothetical protein